MFRWQPMPSFQLNRRQGIFSQPFKAATYPDSFNIDAYYRIKPKRQNSKISRMRHIENEPLIFFSL